MNNNQPIIETKNYRKPKMPKKKKILIAAISSFSALCIAAAGFWFLHPHQWTEWQAVSAPTCVKNGEELRECFCGETETRIIEAFGHDEKIIDGKSATCTQTGLTEGKFCAACETVLLEQTVTPITEHRIEIMSAVAPTCTEAGVTEGKLCADCGTVLLEQTQIAALGHIPETLASKEPTCTADGFTDGTYCTVCLEVLSAQEVIPARHTPVADKGYAPTKTEDGLSDGSHCGVCGEVLEAQTVLHATGSLGLEYSEVTNSDDGKLVGYAVSGIGTCTDTEIIIPEYYNGYLVTTIQRNAFRDCADITAVTMPNTIRFINAYAFENCTGITAITIPNTVGGISNCAFYGCTNLKSVIVPDTITYIGESSFYGCASLKSIIVPDTVTEMGKSAFYGCTSLESLTLPFVGRDKKWADTQYFGYIFGAKRYGEVGYDDVNKYVPASLKTVVITGGKDIMDAAFYDCKNITSITLPNTVKSIGINAFQNCESLKSIIIPESVTKIGSGAFINCTSLESVTLPENLVTIGEWTFRNCEKLTSVTIPKNVTSIGDATFADCPILESIEVESGNTAYYSEGNCLVRSDTKRIIAGCKNSVLPEGVEVIGLWSLYGAEELTSVTVPTTVTNIENFAFGNCSLGSIIYNGSLDEWNAISKGPSWNNGTPSYTVYCNDGEVTKSGTVTHYARVTDPYVAPTCTETGLTEGSHCSVCGKIWVEQQVIPATGHTEVIDYGYAATKTEDGISDGKHCTVCNEVLVPQEIIYAYGSLGLAYKATSETECEITGMGTCTDTDLVIPRYIDGYEVTSIRYSAFANRAEIKSVTFSESLKYFNTGAFAGCIGLEKIEVASGNTTFHSEGNCLIGTADNYLLMGCKTSVIPNGITAIGSSAFENCTVLESITIPNSVEYIYSNAFAGCTGLTSIEIPVGVIRISDSAFKGCTSLTSVTVPNTVTEMGKGVFRDCTKLESITLPFVGKDTKYIDYQYFGYIFGSSPYTGNGEFVPASLKTVVITGRTDIAENAFYGLAGIESISLTGAVKNIGNNAFNGCTGLKNLTLPEGLTSIGTAAFYGCSGLAEVTLPTTLKTIGEWAFIDCTGLTSITIPQGVTSIGNMAFSGCKALESIAIPTSVTTMGYRVFENCTSLESVEIPYQVTSIGNMMFSGCASLTSVTIARGTTKIGNEVFKNCAVLEKITYKGTLDEWAAISTGTDWNSGTGDYTVYCSDGEITKGGEVTHYSQGLAYNVTSDTTCEISEIGTCEDTEVIIPRYIDGYEVTGIGVQAFDDCNSLISVTILESATSIGDYAFSGCRLTTINYNGTIAEWQALPKGTDWDYDTPDYTVYCTDGEIAKDGTVTYY